MIAKLGVALTMLLTTAASAQVAGGAPTQITGIPPVEVSTQIFNETARSFLQPHASGQPPSYSSGRTPEFRARYAAYEARKAARKAAKAATAS